MPTASSTPATSTPTRNCIGRFVALYDEKHAIDQKSPGRAELDVGPDDWPMPIPLVESDGRWTFDTKAGAQTIVDRRIGRNELSAIRTLLAMWMPNTIISISSSRQRVAANMPRAWSARPGAETVFTGRQPKARPKARWGRWSDSAHDAGYPGGLVGGKPIPYGGYNFRILKAQGPNGDGGAKSYIQSGRMIGGFALIAWPAAFESSGIMTFIVGPDGDVYQKDLGPQTARIAAGMATFDPDVTWSRVAMTND